MNFLKRLLYYLFGFSIGLIFLFYFIDKKEATFNYSPNKRVLADIDKKEWIFETNINSSNIKKGYLTKDFKVDFSENFNTQVLFPIPFLNLFRHHLVCFSCFRCS